MESNMNKPYMLKKIARSYRLNAPGSTATSVTRASWIYTIPGPISYEIVDQGYTLLDPKSNLLLKIQFNDNVVLSDANFPNERFIAAFEKVEYKYRDAFKYLSKM